MNKVSLIVLVSVLMFFSVAPVQASLMRQDMGLVRGKVLEYDPKTRMLMVDGSRGEGLVNFDLSAAHVTAPTNPGEEVVIIYKIDGNKATVVKYPPKR